MTQDAHQPPEMDLTSLLDLSTLPDDPRVLKQLSAQSICWCAEETKLAKKSSARSTPCSRACSAAKSLPDCPGQGRLFDETSDEGLTQATAGDELEAALAGLLPGGAPEPAPRDARSHGRRRPAKDLETIDVVHDIADEIKRRSPRVSCSRCRM